jgi:hypothetical protein
MLPVHLCSGNGNICFITRGLEDVLATLIVFATDLYHITHFSWKSIDKMPVVF